MQSKEMSSGIRKEIVRNAEVRNSRATVKRDFSLHFRSDSLSGIEEHLSNVYVSSAASQLKTHKTKKNDLPKDIPASVKTAVDEKASKKLNFHFGEEVFHDLLSLKNAKPTAQWDVLKPLEGPRRQRKVDPEPVMLDYFKREEREFLFCDFPTKGKDSRGFKNIRIERIDLSDELCEQNVNRQERSDGDYLLINEHKGGSANNASDTERLKELHSNFGLPCPKLKFHFDGCRLYRKSQAWRVK